MKHINLSNKLGINFLFVTDFDGTAAQTFAPSPNGLNVNEAYRRSIGTIFGGNGIAIFDKIGCLKNRAPTELIVAILKAASGKRQKLISLAREYFVSHLFDLEKLAPPNKGISMEWPDDDPSWNPVPIIAEMLVRTKLSLLSGEIGKKLGNGRIWPEPCTGFKKFCQTLDRINEEGAVRLELAIVSSGHDFFIEKTFKVWRLPCPRIMVTDDDLRCLTTPARIDERSKPAPFLFDLVHYRWLQSLYPDINPIQLLGNALRSRNRMIYFGDDPKKDGALARNSGVPFGLFSSSSCRSAGCFSFCDWQTIANRLWDLREDLAQANPLQNLFRR